MVVSAAQKERLKSEEYQYSEKAARLMTRMQWLNN